MSVESPLSILDEIDKRIAALTTELSALRLRISDVKYHMQAPVRAEVKVRNEKQGRFLPGDRVYWQNNQKSEVHKGVVIMVVPAHCYPHAIFASGFPGRKYNARTRGYYRYEESYLIEDSKGQQWWPRVGKLNLEKVNERKRKG